MKYKPLFLLPLLFPLIFQAQTIHGIWTGTLVNDTNHRIQNFELGLSEYRGKITGYTYTTFIDNDTFYYSIKRIRAERRDGKLYIMDDEMVGNNFPERAARHVKQTTVFPLINDSTIDITHGSWSTNKTRNFYSITGTATIAEQQDEQKSDLLSHLDEMKIKPDIAVNRKQKTGTETIPSNDRPNTHPDSSNKKHIPNTSTATSNILAADNANQKETVAGKVKSSPDTINKLSHPVSNNLVQNKPISNPGKGNVDGNKNTLKNEIKQTALPDKSLANTSTGQKNVSTPVTDKSKTAKNSSAVVTKLPVKKDTVVQVQKPAVTQNTTTRSNTTLGGNASMIEGKSDLPSAVLNRKNNNMQDVYFKNDSLVLSLYDNGIVDGDTVSVYLNGETIFSRQMLKASAIKKTIFISDKMDSVQLVLFAENLGTIPPNTGLLTVRDGDDIYQVRFSADLQKNASIIFRRKK